jgi:ankyrin repeat protein
LEVVRVLLEGGADTEQPIFNNNTALHFAALNGCVDVCRLLLDWGAKVDTPRNRKYTPLLEAARGGHLSVVKLLVERGADVSVRNVFGRNASEEARSFGNEDVAEWLDKVVKIVKNCDLKQNVSIRKIFNIHA